MEDFANHTSTYEDPISTVYRGIEVWEIPPNGQGIIALMALNILEGFNLKGEFFDGEYAVFQSKTCHFFSLIHSTSSNLCIDDISLLI